MVLDPGGSEVDRPGRMAAAMPAFVATIEHWQEAMAAARQLGQSGGD